MDDAPGWLEQIQECKHLSEPAMKRLCDKVTEIFVEEGNIEPVAAPVLICGDIHGQFWDLKELFRLGGSPPTKSYVFLVRAKLFHCADGQGDYVDRGYHSLETVTWLLVLKLLYPARILLLRGNHESRQTSQVVSHLPLCSQVYGFYEECMQKYGSPNVWRWVNDVFDYLPIAGLIDNRLLCVHGGLSPECRTLDQVTSPLIILIPALFSPFSSRFLLKFCLPSWRLARLHYHDTIASLHPSSLLCYHLLPVQ